MTNDVGSRIRQAFDRFGVTSQAGLARALRVQRVTVSRWITNGRRPQKRHVRNMARLARVSPDAMNRHLYFGEELPDNGRKLENAGQAVQVMLAWVEADTFPPQLQEFFEQWCRNPGDPNSLTDEIGHILNEETKS